MYNEKTKYFDFYYKDIDTDVKDIVTRAIDEIYEKVTADFRVQVTDTKYEFYLCADVDDYLIYTGKAKEDYQEWMIGWADYETRRVCILSPRIVTDRSYEDVMKVIKHEIVHIALDSLGNPDEISIWLAEGVAVSYAKQIEKKYLDNKKFPLILDIEDEDGFYNNDGYYYSGIYVWYLIQKFGTETFKKIYTGKEKLDKYYYDMFENEAIEAFQLSDACD